MAKKRASKKQAANKALIDAMHLASLEKTEDAAVPRAERPAGFMPAPASLEGIAAELREDILERVYASLSEVPAKRQEFFRKLCTTSKIIRIATLPFLYRHLDRKGYALGPLVRTFGETPSLARYVLSLDPEPRSFDNQPASSKELDVFKKIAAPLRRHATLFERLSNAFRRGDSSAKLAFISLLCKNLRVLRITPSSGNNEAERWIGRLLDFAASERSKPYGARIFPQLRSLTSNSAFAPENIRLENIHFVVNLSSVNTLEIFPLNTGQSALISDDDVFSKITGLTLRGNLSLSDFSQYKTLSTLTVVSNLNELGNTLNVLKDNKSSLEHLSIHIFNNYSITPGMLDLKTVFSALSHLKTLDLDDWMICDAAVWRDSSFDHPQSLHVAHLDLSVLPSTLESLTIKSQKHPRVLFRIIKNLITKNYAPRPMKQFQLQFTMVFEPRNTNIAVWLRYPEISLLTREKAIEELCFSTETFDYTALMRTPKNAPVWALNTIEFKPYHDMKTGLRENGLVNHLEELHYEGISLKAPTVQLFDQSTAGKSLLQLRHRLGTVYSMINREQTDYEEARDEAIRVRNAADAAAAKIANEEARDARRAARIRRERLRRERESRRPRRSTANLRGPFDGL